MRWLFCLLLSAWAAPLCAHPVPKSNHDRKIVVRLLPATKPDEVVVRVEYRLEVDETTVILEDMAPFRDEIDFTRFAGKPLEYYAEFAKIYGPQLAARLDVRLGGKEYPCPCIRHGQTLTDEDGKGLGHLRCDFVFEATLPVRPGSENLLRFREGNYLLDAGKIDVSFAAAGDIQILNRVEPSEALKAKLETELVPGDDDRLRQLRITFIPPAPALPTPLPPNPTLAPAPASSVLRLLQSDQGVVLLYLLAAAFGAVHALTPGHGKTLVAAYLVGQQGSVWHAVVLGIVTTVTHTGAVFVFAVVLKVFPESSRAEIQNVLGFVMGLIIVCLGFCLLLQRLAGRADHIHIGGGHHHHADHGHGHALPDGRVSTWGLVTLGISGGLVPCWDAVAMLMLAVSMNMLELAIPLLLAFSAGLAGVLVLIGILVVKVRRFAGSRLGEGRLIRALPIVSALFIQAMGFWLCYESVHGA